MGVFGEVSMRLPEVVIRCSRSGCAARDLRVAGVLTAQGSGEGDAGSGEWRASRIRMREWRGHSDRG